MQVKKILNSVILIAGSAALPATAAETIGNWYIGAGAGQARADTPNTAAVVVGTPVTSVATSGDSTSTGAKAFLGYQFNKYIAAEGGYFRLGDFTFDATTTPAGTLHGSYKNRSGWNLDAVGSLPLFNDKFSLLGRVGVQSSKTSDLFNGTGAATALTNPSPSKNKVSYKYGAGAEYDFTKNIGVRAEWERYRVSDGINSEVNVNLVSGSLLYRF
ncbi:MAG: OmpA/MotB domain protein [Betaproteobacteria bacterium]|nr:OmpA/MotB domain protein [Betaproteobacteria bacterium]